MKQEAAELLAEYVLGSLPEGERRQVRAELEASPALASAADALTEDLASLASLLPPLAPAGATRARLLHSLAGADRFSAFVAEIARRFDMAAGAVRQLLTRVDDPRCWEPSPLPGVTLIHFQAGPALAGADAGFVKLAAGTAFPRHRHLGAEMGMVLEGTLHDGGKAYGPGEVIEYPEGSAHDYAAGPGRDLLMMVAHRGIELELTG
jgi:anti-sigma factor ChrR (cupin superfamily)